MLNLPLINLLIPNKSIIVSVFIHFSLLVITFYHFEKQEILSTKNQRVLEVAIVISPKIETKETKHLKNLEMNNNKKKNNEVISKKKVLSESVKTKVNNNVQRTIIKPLNKTNKSEIESELKDESPSIHKNPNNRYKNIQEKQIYESIKKKNLPKKNTEHKDYEKKLKEYKYYLTKKIQTEALNNYPRVSLRRNEEGEVEIIFSLNSEGEIKEINIGKKTNASVRLEKSLINVLKNKIVKFKKNEILKKINTFSIIIVYKLK